MADLVMNLYLNGGKKKDDDDKVNDDNISEQSTPPSSYEQTDGDVFSRLALDVSTCQLTREDSGEIGWVDNPNNNHQDKKSSSSSITTKKSTLNDVYKDILSSDAIEEVFSRRVKGGDVLKVQGTDGKGWHLTRVDDLYIKLQDTVATAASTTDDAASSKNRRNKVRPKLKGSGQIPLSPIFQKIGTTTDFTNDTNSNNGIENDDEQSKMIYSVPNAKHYQILTSGCQMNQADSERIMGVLEGELGLTSLDAVDAIDTTVDPTLIASSSGNKTTKKGKKKPTPDILLLNT